MGQARQRGSFETRKTQALVAGRRKQKINKAIIKFSFGEALGIIFAAATEKNHCKKFKTLEFDGIKK